MEAGTFHSHPCAVGTECPELEPSPLFHAGHEPAHPDGEHAPRHCGLHPGGAGPGGVAGQVCHTGQNIGYSVLDTKTEDIAVCKVTEMVVTAFYILD
jgi:hypothetical protein